MFTDLCAIVGLSSRKRKSSFIFFKVCCKDRYDLKHVFARSLKNKPDCKSALCRRRVHCQTHTYFACRQSGAEYPYSRLGLPNCEDSSYGTIPRQALRWTTGAEFLTSTSVTGTNSTPDNFFWPIFVCSSIPWMFLLLVNKLKLSCFKAGTKKSEANSCVSISYTSLVTKTQTYLVEKPLSSVLNVCI